MPPARKAQVAYEFLLLFFVLVTGFTLWTILSAQAQDHLEFQRRELLMEDFGLGLQHRLYTAAQMSDGFTQNLTLPTTLDGHSYNVTLDNETGWLTVRVGSLEGSYTIPDMSVPHELEKTPATNTIRKHDGELVVNEAEP